VRQDRLEKRGGDCVEATHPASKRRSSFACCGGAFTAPRLPSGESVGSFSADNYWSSSENSATNAWNQNFNNGNQNNNNKTNTNRVARCGVFDANH